MSKKYLVFGGIVLLVVIAALVFVLLNPGEGSSMEAANSYVPPGQLDQYYLFASGGHSGQVFVIGVPSMRRIRTIPVFSVDSATGWGFEDRSKKMLGDLTWGDAHHSLSTVLRFFSANTWDCWVRSWRRCSAGWAPQESSLPCGPGRPNGSSTSYWWGSRLT